MVRFVRLLIRWACPAVVAFAAFMKLVSFDRFAENLESFTLLDPRIAFAALFVVLVVELVPLGLCIVGRYRIANWACFGLWVVFTAVVAVHWRENVMPTFQCFGEWVSYRASENQYINYFVRNAIMMIASAAAAVAAGTPRRRTYESVADGSIIDANSRAS